MAKQMKETVKRKAPTPKKARRPARKKQPSSSAVMQELIDRGVPREEAVHRAGTWKRRPGDVH
jgi:hypothetical protein